MIITATNRFVTAPIAARLGVETLIATECEMENGRYTGRSTDVPCFREGKVTRLNRWLDETGYTLDDSYFYSDSMNDLPLLEQVTHAVAVDPDPNMRAEAEKRGWPVITLRSRTCHRRQAGSCIGIRSPCRTRLAGDKGNTVPSPTSAWPPSNRKSP